MITKRTKANALLAVLLSTKNDHIVTTLSLNTPLATSRVTTGSEEHFEINYFKQTTNDDALHQSLPLPSRYDTKAFTTAIAPSCLPAAYAGVARALASKSILSGA